MLYSCCPDMIDFKHHGSSSFQFYTKCMERSVRSRSVGIKVKTSNTLPPQHSLQNPLSCLWQQFNINRLLLLFNKCLLPGASVSTTLKDKSSHSTINRNVNSNGFFLGHTHLICRGFNLCCISLGTLVWKQRSTI